MTIETIEIGGANYTVEGTNFPRQWVVNGRIVGGADTATDAVAVMLAADTRQENPAEQQEALLSSYSAAIQNHMDATARLRQYDGIQTAITYRNDPNPQFAAEGEALFIWRSAVWTYSTAELEKVMAGERSQPSVEEFVAELPAFEWPV